MSLYYDPRLLSNLKKNANDVGNDFFNYHNIVNQTLAIMDKQRFNNLN